MTAPDFTARGIALRAAAHSPLTFSELAAARLPASVKRIETCGHSAAGWGAASYVSDAAATAALAAAHPLAVFAGADGRYFRLLGDHEGFVTPEQFGCPAYAAGSNVRPQIQAAVNYCKAVGLKGVKFPQARYEMWVGLHAGSFTDYTDHSGNFIVIDQFACSLVSSSAGGTVFDCKGPTGGSALTDYQVINSSIYGGDVIWRGAAIKLTASVSTGLPNPGDAALSHLTMKGITFYTGTVAALNAAWPCHPPSRTPGRENAWDISNKGVWCQNDKWVGNITIIDGGFDGFLGEHIYCGGGLNSNQRVVCRNYVSKNSNGSSFNPNGPRSLDVDGAYCENVVGVIEGWMGWDYGRFINVRARNCGGGGELKGGYHYDGLLRPDGSQPVTTVDVTFENCGEVYIGSFCHGRLTCIDTTIVLLVQSSTMLIRNVDIDVDMWVHARSPSQAIRYVGWTAAGSQQLRNTSIRLKSRRTREAEAANLQIPAIHSQKFSIGPNNLLSASGYFASCGSIGDTPTDNVVTLVDDGLVTNWISYGNTFDPTTTPSPTTWFGGTLRPVTWAGGAGVWPVNLPAVALYADRAEIAISHRDGGTAGAASLLEIQEGGVKRALLGYKDRARFRCNRFFGKWDLVEAPAPRTASASVNISATALGAESGPYVIPAAGCRPWHRCDILPPASLGGYVISASRTEADQVRFWVRNLDGVNLEDPAAMTFTARFSLPPM